MNVPQKPPQAAEGASETGASASDEAHPEASARALTHLQSEFRLVERTLRIERQRVAELADSWGHGAFARFLRERMSRDGNAER
ncbi:MAG: hypothetical protein RI988_2095 [Pseudomonadota bacterium]|jgi:hypothetical protein